MLPDASIVRIDDYLVVLDIRAQVLSKLLKFMNENLEAIKAEDLARHRSDDLIACNECIPFKHTQTGRKIHHDMVIVFSDLFYKILYDEWLFAQLGLGIRFESSTDSECRKYMEILDSRGLNDCIIYETPALKDIWK